VPLTAIVAVREPPVVGVNVTLTVHVAAAANVAPQLLVCAKSELSAPARLIPVMFKGEFPAFTSITAAGLLLVPTACGAKFALAG
jgi:hypothetical protein